MAGQEYLTMSIDDASRRIRECEGHCKIFLRAVLQGKTFVDYSEDVIHFTGAELKKGYAMLREEGSQLSADHSTHVLFIKDIKHIIRGTLLEYNDAIKIIMPDQKEKRERIIKNS